MKVKIPFIGPAYAFTNASLAVQETINYYLEIEVGQGNQREPIALRGVPGMTAFATVPGACRALGAFNLQSIGAGDLYIVAGTQFGRIDRTGSFTPFGTIPGSGNLFMREVINWIVISDLPFDVLDGYVIFPERVNFGYTFNKETGVFGIISDTDFSAFGGNEIFISELEDPNSYDGLDHTAINTRFNIIRGVVVSNRQIIIFGTEIIDFWYNSGGELFPFSRSEGLMIELGCISPSTIERGDDTVYFLAKNKKVYKILNGHQEEISTPIVNEDIAAQTDLQMLNAKGFYYNWKGHQFYNLTLANGKTWVYDNTLGPQYGWSRRKSFGITNWRGIQASEVYGSVFVGDFTLGTVWKLDNTVYTEGTALLEATRTGNYFHSDQKTFKMGSVEVVCEQGATSLDTDPGIFLSFTKDGGKNFSAERERKFSDTRLLWRNNGVSHGSMAFKIRTTARRNRDIVSFTADPAAGNDR